MANEIQERAREYLENLAAEQDAKRKELGVDDNVMELEGMTVAFAVKFGENDVKDLEDIAGLVPDDITGWREPGPDGKPVFQEGILKKGEMRKDEAQIFIMRARVAAGWVEPEALAELEAQMASDAEGVAANLTAEERALLALGDIGKGGDDAGEDLAEEELIFDLDALAAAEDGADEASGDGDDADTKE